MFYFIQFVETPGMGRNKEELRKQNRTFQPTHFSYEQQVDLAEWFEANLCLYNKKLASYKNKDMKEQIWEEKAVTYSPQSSGKY